LKRQPAALRKPNPGCIRPKTASAASARAYHALIDLDPDTAWKALATHDARYDGRLFIGVTSTRVYCRPICRVRTARRENCRFFPNAAMAEQAGFRPCAAGPSSRPA
jgi:hypothetical protein